MIILGPNSDETGAELEDLTRRLLAHSGYQNIELNMVGPGGQELDITAQFPIPNLGGGGQPEQLIGECKAYQALVTLPEWLKFVGKLHVEEVKSHQPRRGLFVALNGVNPNVRASYRQLVSDGERLTLFEGDQLLSEALQVFGGANRETVVAELKKLTGRQFVKIESAYRAQQLYWVFTFGDGAIALLKGDGSVLSGQEMHALAPSLANRFDNATVIDLLAEKEAIQRSIVAQKDCLACLFLANGAQTEADVRKYLGDFSDAEVAGALKALKSRNWISVDGDHVCRLLPDAGKDGFPAFCDLLGFFLSDQLRGIQYETLATSELFQKLFDEQALALMSQIQGNMPLPKDDCDHVLWLVKHSPSALAYALHPDPMIQTHRIKQDVNSAEIDAEDARRFMRSLLSRFAHDFQQPGLKNFYFKRRELVEVEVQQITKIKGRNALILERETTNRTGIGQFAEEHGGGLILIDLLTTAPQPWEWMNKAPDQPAN